jgi:hypothetical protein
MKYPVIFFILPIVQFWTHKGTSKGYGGHQAVFKCLSSNSSHLPDIHLPKLNVYFLFHTSNTSAEVTSFAINEQTQDNASKEKQRK